MGGYTKLFSSIVTSTIWCEDYPTRLVWITMLAMKNWDGVVEGSIIGFARVANVTVAEMKKAIQVLSSPDPDSRTPDNEGRRIEVVAGGWRVLNHEAYNFRESPDHRREVDAARQRRHRSKAKNVTRDVTPHNAKSEYTDLNQDTNTDKVKTSTSPGLGVDVRELERKMGEEGKNSSPPSDCSQQKARTCGIATEPARPGPGKTFSGKDTQNPGNGNSVRLDRSCNPRPDWGAYFAHFRDRIKAKKGLDRYEMSKAHRGILARLYDVFGPETVMALWDLFWMSDKPWSEYAKSRGHALEVFADNAMIQQVLDAPDRKSRAEIHRRIMDGEYVDWKSRASVQ